MAMADIVLNVEVREQTGTGGARAIRRSGKVPGVLYGGDKDPVAIAVQSNEFRKALYTGKLLGHLVTLKYGAETQPVIARRSTCIRSAMSRSTSTSTGSTSISRSRSKCRCTSRTRTNRRA
jgi:ribosomal protein L25 (general stress protein Ctc)